MIMDSLCVFSDAQSAAGSAASAADSTYCLDLTGGNAAKDGHGTSIADMISGGVVYLNAQVTTVIASTGACLLHVKLMGHTTTSTFGSGNVIATLIFPEDAAAGTKKSVAVGNYNFASTERYLGVSLLPTGGTAIASGNVEVWLSTSPPDTVPLGTQST